jgi:hypothetical protein
MHICNVSKLNKYFILTAYPLNKHSKHNGSTFHKWHTFWHYNILEAQISESGGTKECKNTSALLDILQKVGEILHVCIPLCFNSALHNNLHDGGNNKRSKIPWHSSRTMKVLEKLLSLLKAGSTILEPATCLSFPFCYCTSMSTRRQSCPSSL